MLRTRLLAALCTVALAGCEEVLGSCPDAEAGWNDHLALRADLLSEPAEGPYAAALVVSEPALNTLLAQVSDLVTPPTLRESLGVVQVSFRPDFPELRIAAVQDCAGCLLAAVGFDVSVGVTGLGDFGGSGSALLGLPLTLQPRANNALQSALVAGLDQAVVEDVNFSVQGLSLNDFPQVRQLVSQLAQRYLRQEFGATELGSVDPLTVGEEGAAFAARGPTVFPQQASVVVGLAGNLPLPDGSSLSEQATLPQGVELALRLHPGMLLAAMQRLTYEGDIPQSYDAQGNALENGGNRVAVQALERGDNGGLRTTLRVFQLDGLCGTVDVASNLSLAVTDREVRLSASDLEVVGGTGAGQFLASDWASSDILDALVGNLELTLNWNDVQVADDEDEDFAASGIVVDGDGVTVQLDLL